MLAHWPHLLLLLPAVPLAREDFRMRTVSVLWLVVLGGGSVCAGWLAVGLRAMLWRTAANTGVLLLFGGALLLYHLSRRRSMRDFFTRSFGEGDAAMMLAVAPFFSPAGYVRFLLISSLAALGWWLFRRPATIPLAGFMALTLAGYVLSETAGIWS